MPRPNAGDDSNPRSGEGGARKTPAQLATDPAFTATYASPQGAWSSATAYTVNQVVTYNGGTYRAKAASTNVTPGTDGTKWESWGGGGLTGVGGGSVTTTAQIAADSAVAYLQKFDPMQSLYNANANSIRNFRAAVARARSGGANAHIVIVGDSITEGYYSTQPYYTNSWGARLRSLLAARTGVNAGTGIIHSYEFSFAGGGNSFAQDNRVVLTGTYGTQWGKVNQSGAFGNYLSQGGGMFVVPNASATLTFGAITADQFIVYYWKDQATVRTVGGLPGGSCAVTLDAVSQTALNCAGAFSRNVATYTPASEGSHTLVINGPTVASTYGLILGVEARRGGGTGGVRVTVAGASGTIAADALNGTVTDVISPLASMYDMAAPDLTLIAWGINEYDGAGKGTQTSPATYATNIQTHITRAKQTGDVMLVLPYNSGRAATGGSATWSQYVTQAYALADTNSIPLLDLTDRWGSYATSNALGMYFDTLHPNDKGHQDVADAAFSALIRMGAGL